MTTRESDIEILDDGNAVAPDGARGRLLITRWPKVPSLAELREEALAQADRWSLWSPVALGLGCAAYFSLPTEPSWPVVIAAFAVAAVVAGLGRRLSRWGAVGALLTLVALAAGGLMLAKVRTARVAAPVAPVMEISRIEGWVVDVASPGASGQRLIIAPTHIEGLSPDQTPLRIRMTVRGEVAAPGGAISFRGLVNPPPPPAAPGAYDFARNAWFDGVGGVGVALTDLREVNLPEPPARLRAQMDLNALRWRLAERINQAMGEAGRGLGAAMITGHEAWIDPETEDALRDAGLAHIVSISGLHMAIVGGFVFFLVRALVAAVPPLALRVSGKKLAALAGLAAVSGYLLISGAPAPAQRAAVTAAVAFAAILVDRRAISLHALALAAFVVLLIQPEAVVEPGFQMSFAATAALVALAEAWPPRISEINTPWPILAVQRTIAWIGVSLAASFVAGLATGPFAIQHFNRVAVYGLAANLLTAPLSGFVIMPALAVGGVLAPLGLGAPFLAVAGWGLDLMNSLAAKVAAAPNAVLVVASAPPAALPIAFMGILWMCLWRGRLRWLGLPLALAVTLWPRPEPPLAWIAADGSTAALAVQGGAVLMRPNEKLFGAELWAGRRGLDLPTDGEAVRDRYFVCVRNSCRAIGQAGLRLSAWWTIRKPKPPELTALCEASDVLVMKAEVDLPAACAGVTVLRPADFAAGGAVEIYRDAKGVRLQWAQPLRGDRPWTAPGGVEG